MNNPNFHYQYSKAIDKHYAIRKKKPDKIIFEDGVTYTFEEAKKIKGASPETILDLHLLKSVFGGEVLAE